MAKTLVNLTDEEYNKVLPRIRIKLRRSARAYHRFKNRIGSGRLSKSISTVYNRSNRGISMLAPAVSPLYNVPYAQFVINGHGTWLPDPFLESALDREHDYITKQTQKAVDNAVVRYNNQKGGNSGRVHSGI